MFSVPARKTQVSNKSKRSVTLLLLFFAITSTFANNFVFTPINTTNGLSDNQIRYILQLSDGRMVFTTHGNVNIYNGADFTQIHRTSEHVYPLTKYDGFYRIYQDGDSLLWIKDQFKLFCIRLFEEKYDADLNRYFHNKSVKSEIEDLFMDDESRMWFPKLNFHTIKTF